MAHDDNDNTETDTSPASDHEGKKDPSAPKAAAPKEPVRFRKKTKEEDWTEIISPEENLSRVFGLFDTMANGHMTFPSYVSLIKMVWSFVSFDRDLDELVTSEELKQGLASFKPPIHFTDQENHGLFALNDQWLELQYFKINIKEFLAFQGLQRLIDLKVTPDLIGHGSWQSVKSVLVQLGMRVSDITLSLCNDESAGVSSTNVNRQSGTFNFYKAFKESLKDELNALAMVYEHRTQRWNEERV